MAIFVNCRCKSFIKLVLIFQATDSSIQRINQYQVFGQTFAFISISIIFGGHLFIVL